MSSAAISSAFRSTGERQDFLLGVARAKARIAGEELRVFAASEEIAEDTTTNGKTSFTRRQ